MSFRRKLSASHVEGRELSSFLGFLPLWDMSNEPSNNADLSERLGEAAKVRGVAIVGHDKETGATTYADGVTHKRNKNSAAPIDPDSFVFRLFGSPGRRFGTWMVRLTADMHENQSGENCRSTMITDNETDMSFAWLTDAVSLVSAQGGDLIGEGLAYDQAGFLEGLYEKEYDFATYKRCALSFSLHRNKGFVDDGNSMGQLSQMMTLVPDGSGTVAAATGRGGTARTGAELAFRADAPIKFSSGIGRLHVVRDPGAKDVESDEPRLVHLILHTLGTEDDHFDTAEDPNSDFARLPKKVKKQIIRGFVRVPRGGGGGCEDPEYPYSYHSDMSNGGDEGSGGSGAGEGGSETPSDDGSHDSDTEAGDNAAGEQHGSDRPDTPTFDDRFNGPDGYPRPGDD